MITFYKNISLISVSKIFVSKNKQKITFLLLPIGHKYFFSKISNEKQKNICSWSPDYDVKIMKDGYAGWSLSSVPNNLNSFELRPFDLWAWLQVQFVVHKTLLCYFAQVFLLWKSRRVIIVSEKNSVRSVGKF